MLQERGGEEAGQMVVCVSGGDDLIICCAVLVASGGLGHLRSSLSAGHQVHNKASVSQEGRFADHQPYWRYGVW